jgi:very-short-patch-repair endonuclease
MSDKPAPVKRARELRQRMTVEEKLLWERLRNRKFHDLKFLRQHPIVYEIINNEPLYFVVDFYCAEKRLVIELDGKIHDFHKTYDKDRDEILKNYNWNILRIKNTEFADIYAVMEKIYRFILC